jgi:hypothetical protein
MASQAGQRRAKERAAVDRGPAISITLDDEVYTLAAKDMTALDVRELRQQTGYSYNSLSAAARADMDIDLLAAVVWMSRRIAGERDLDFSTVAAGINYTATYNISTQAEVDAKAASSEEDLPEA